MTVSKPVFVTYAIICNTTLCQESPHRSYQMAQCILIIVLKPTSKRDRSVHETINR